MIVVFKSIHSWYVRTRTQAGSIVRSWGQGGRLNRSFYVRYSYFSPKQNIFRIFVLTNQLI